MCDRRDEDVIRLHAIHDRVWESVKNKAALATQSSRPSHWCFRDAGNGVIDFKAERLRRSLAARAVPIPRFG
jgi:hypothetical protein